MLDMLSFTQHGEHMPGPSFSGKAALNCSVSFFGCGLYLLLCANLMHNVKIDARLVS